MGSCFSRDAGENSGQRVVATATRQVTNAPAAGASGTMRQASGAIRGHFPKMEKNLTSQETGLLSLDGTGHGLRQSQLLEVCFIDSGRNSGKQHPSMTD
jgi:hypothetical protein